MNFNEMFWFTLSEASSIVGFPRPKQMSAVSSSCLQKAKESHVAGLFTCSPCPAHPLASPHFLERKSYREHQAGGALKPCEFQNTEITSGDYDVFPVTEHPVSLGESKTPVPRSWGPWIPAPSGRKALAAGPNSRSRPLPGRTQAPHNSENRI